MFKCLVFFCVIAAAFAEPGILTPSLRLAAAPAIVSAPVSVGLVRTAPIVAAPLGVTGGLVSNGLVSKGLVSGGILNSGLLSGKLLAGGLIR